MPVTNVDHDIEALTLTINAEFDAPRTRIWQLYADPRQLEKIWGPPTHPATVVEHNFTPGGRVTYYMTGPEGDKYAGLWDISAIDEPKSFEFEDRFADSEFNPVDSLPVSANTFSFEETDGRTTATYVSTYESAENLQQVLDMGVVEGASSAINQIDDLIAARA